MTGFTAEEHLTGLTGFQRSTVDHVTERFYQHGARRFLVADETGLGKSLVARGVIARTVERLQDCDEVGRIDIVYVCSNTDIAKQNLSRLRIGNATTHTVASRLTMLAKHSRHFGQTTGGVGKPVNLVAFTPGTSFEQGWRTGKVEERALLFLLLREQLGLSGWDERAARVALRGGVRDLARFQQWERSVRGDLDGAPDPLIARRFTDLCVRHGLDQRLREMLDRIGRHQDVPKSLRPTMYELTGELRMALARASIETLEPDLIILDEFQRFRRLLSVETGGASAELAKELFGYRDARVLLLSATPYKPFTMAEEADGDNHYRDFVELLEFLRDDGPWRDAVASLLRDYRSATISGRDGATIAAELRARLLEVMCRTERPALGQDRMLTEHVHQSTPDTRDLLGYTALRGLAAELGGAATVEYWKSAPYFVNFMDGYILGDALRKAVTEPECAARVAPAIAAAQRLDREDIRAFRPVDPGNGKLRELMSGTVRSGQPRLLWLPPSLPYHRLAEPFPDTAHGASLTKHLIFSSWSATPTAIAALVSYEAERQLLAKVMENSPEARRRFPSRLDYRVDSGRPGAMTTLMLFWPHPGLATTVDPLALAGRHPGRLLTADELTAAAAALLTSSRAAKDDDTGLVQAFFAWPEALPFDAEPREFAAALSGGTADSDQYTGLHEHVQFAVAGLWFGTEPRTAGAELAELALHAPGTVAWRALGRLRSKDDEITRRGHWEAAAMLTSGLRTLFSRPETIALLDRIYGEEPYWRKVLRYSAAGCLQAVLDEYLHQLRISDSSGTLNDARLMELATTARDALALRTSTYRAFDPEHPKQPINFPSRFALRYGAARNQADDLRPAEVRTAFNSPFWPFVLATTSAGQEGIDFHWWSHAVVHWNTPANPVDFEQREGRVHRYGGHAIRKNIATAHRKAILAAGETDPWRAAFRIAADHAGELGEFAPYWLYPGPATIERHLPQFALSRDIAKSAELKGSLALYRMAFGQPRQEDFLNLVESRVHSGSAPVAIDLRPPSAAAGESC